MMAWRMSESYKTITSASTGLLYVMFSSRKMYAIWSTQFPNASFIISVSCYMMFKGATNRNNLIIRNNTVNWGFSYLSSVLPGKCQDSILNYSTTTFTHILLSFFKHEFRTSTSTSFTGPIKVNEISTMLLNLINLSMTNINTYEYT